ncbi:NAD(P)-dependent oxidoreductase [Tenacibaculum caenipelagi]|uniref:NAD(P)-dependent oxidoreductase n=1 Tax=Tenacibaculum caenipelagi TaxID=1325435 RepID=UPI001414E765|nr:NAD(P)-dependent oxidoreductase [Tenacibaculum caenipelagi]
MRTLNNIYPVKGIVAVPYSADLNAVEQLKKEGFNIIVPDSVSDTFTKSEEMALDYLNNNKEPLVIQEVGGYLAKSTNKLSEFEQFIGIVEDTNNGHWRYEQTAPHNCPILSMAQSPLKFVEDTIIGDAIIYSVERVIREDYSAILQGMRAGVIGFGKIGRSSAVALKGRESVVSIYDINPSKNMSAKVEGFYPFPLNQLLTQSDLIVGCTGQTSIRLVDMPYIKEGAILASGSSKNIEFDLDGFATKCRVEKINEVITRYTRNADNKSFYILNNGTPINFRDKSILGTILDMIYCELFVCLREVVNGKVKKGLHKSEEYIQNEVSKAWLRAHSPTFSDAPEDKVWDYPESLKLGLPK